MILFWALTKMGVKVINRDIAQIKNFTFDFIISPTNESHNNISIFIFKSKVKDVDKQKKPT
jgi:hypothetical protein